MTALIDSLDPRAARNLGHALIERARYAEAAERLTGLTLTSEGVDRLAELVMAGKTPSLGFWRRYGRRNDAGA